MNFYRELVWTLIIAFVVFVVAALWPDTGEAKPDWQPGIASYYVLDGNRTACGKTAGYQTWFVASLSSENARCGLKVTICNRARRRCAKVTVQDSGDFSLGRAFDLQPRVKSALRCSDLCSVHWSRGWAH